MKRERLLLAALLVASFLFLVAYSCFRVEPKYEEESESGIETIIVEEATETETESETETETETETEEETEIETEPAETVAPQTAAPAEQPAPQTETVRSAPETQPVTEPVIETEPPTETETPTETEAHTETEIETDPPVETEATTPTLTDEHYLLAYVIWHEAGNQPYEGMQAVGIVVMNRVRSGAFPNDVYSVINQQNQFFPLSVATAKANYDWLPQGCKDAAAYALAGGTYAGNIDMSGMYFFCSGANSYGDIKIGGHYFRAKYR